MHTSNHMLSISVRSGAQNTYMGTLRESLAHIIAMTLCVKVGDVVTLSENLSEYEWDSYYRYDEPTITHTYFHNGTDVVHFTDTEYYNSDVEQEYDNFDLDLQKRTMKDKTYTKYLTGFKYNREDARHNSGSRHHISYMKREINRAERRVGKIHISEQMS